MMQSWWNMARLAAESQQVIALRLMKLAAGGPAAQAEASRMVSEKMKAGAEAATRLMSGASADSVIGDYRRKVEANRRRLTRE